MIIETIQLYENRPDVTLTTYVLSDSPEMLNGRKRPAVLVCPGGGYLGCSDREAEPVALRFAAMGYHAFVLRYSTYHNGTALPAITNPVNIPNPNSIYPSPMRDIGKAFLIIHDHAEEWLVDVDKIAICGFSAGGHNCAMYAVYWHTPELTEHFAKPPELFKPAVAIVGYGVLNFYLMGSDTAEAIAKDLDDAVKMAYLGTTTPTPELLDTVSPVFHVTDKTPPMFLWATADDGIVPVENTTHMAQALAQARIPLEVHIFEEGVHGLSLANQSTAGEVSQINADAAKWMDLAENWLKKRFAIQVPSNGSGD